MIVSSHDDILKRGTLGKNGFINDLSHISIILFSFDTTCKVDSPHGHVILGIDIDC